MNLSADEPARILVVEDEPQLAAVLCDYLKASGYETCHLADGEAVLDTFTCWQPGLVLLDLMLPGADGVSLCRELRAHSDVPVIMVTARVDEVDRLLGLSVGADDYICKPFSPRRWWPGWGRCCGAIGAMAAVVRQVRMRRSLSLVVWRCPRMPVRPASGRRWVVQALHRPQACRRPACPGLHRLVPACRGACRERACTWTYPAVAPRCMGAGWT